VPPSTSCSRDGFVLDENGRKMSKSLGNVVGAAGRDQAIGGADILRMWVCACRLCGRPAHRIRDPQDHGRDLSQAGATTIRWMLGSLAQFPRRGSGRPRTNARARAARCCTGWPRSTPRCAPRLWGVRLQAHLCGAQRLHAVDLSAFYFDIRKDTLVLRSDLLIEPAEACLTVLRSSVPVQP